MSKIKNIMSIDFEDYFCDLPFATWNEYENRVIKTTPTLLELFSKYDVKATFFVVGYFAEKFPELIKGIHDEGHEIASHSFSHIDLRKASKMEIEKDLIKSFEVLENVTGEKVLGFRAPFFSIDDSNSWVIDFLKKHIKYDSSIFPVKSPLYGMPDAPRDIYHPSEKNFIKNDESEEFIEIPLLTNRILSCYNLPSAGGFYFRSLPYFLISQGIKKFNHKNKPSMLYFHPKDLDINMPKIKEYSWHYYYGKRNILKKFEKLLNDFEFTSAKNFLNL
jgi:polysaccharide deacetylase family protein (PEP-CTERM system associated)